MQNFERVDSRFGHLDYMRREEAELVRDMVIENDARELLEIGFYHGKSSAYFAAILEDAGRGHLVTIDLVSAQKREPNIETVLSSLQLQHRVTPIYAERSYTWELAKMIQAKPKAGFDLCYFDGGHTWDMTGFGFLLVDMLLRPGGLIVFDDLQWTIADNIKHMDKVPRHWLACSKDEQNAPAVSMVYELLVPHLGYEKVAMANNGRWGIARKPIRRTKPIEDVGILSRILGAISSR